MKIAVTYENEEIFQHFGHCEAFKLYETEDGKVVSSQVVGTGGSGHEALAVFLKNLGVEVPWTRRELNCIPEQPAMQIRLWMHS